MSMWTVCGFSLIVNDYDKIKEIAALNGYSDPEGSGDCDRMYEFVIDHDGVFMDEEAEKKRVSYAASDPKDSEDVVFAACFYARKQPNPFEAAYESLGDVVKEFRERMKFPEDFDVQNHIGTFSCVDWD